MPKVQPISIYVSEETKKELSEIAKNEKRTLSSTIKLILEEYCEERNKKIG